MHIEEGTVDENDLDKVHGQEASGADDVTPNRHLGSASIDVDGPSFSFANFADLLVAARDDERTDWENAHGPAKSWLLSQPASYRDARWEKHKRLASAIDAVW